MYEPRLEPTAPIRLADWNHAHYPSRHCTILKKRWLNDGLPAHAIQSTRESSEDVTRTLDAPPSKVHSDIFPRSRRASSQTLEHLPPRCSNNKDIWFRKKGVRINYKLKKIPEGQEHAPRLEPTAPIRLADRNHAHYPSRHCTILKKGGSMTDYCFSNFYP